MRIPAVISREALQVPRLYAIMSVANSINSYLKKSNEGIDILIAKGGGDMKKKIVICVFLTVILITAIFFIAAAIDSYNYDMDPANGVDILEGFGAVLAIMIGAFFVFYELDLFYTVYYFLIKPKTIAKSILNVLANLSLLLVFFGDCYGDIFSEDYLAPIIVFAIYAVLRISCLIIPYRKM